MARGLGEALKKHGPESIALLSSSKCTNEENYLIEKLARMLGTPHVDNCARLCHAPSVVGLNRTLGAAGMTNPIPDIANSQVHIRHRLESGRKPSHHLPLDSQSQGRRSDGNSSRSTPDPYRLDGGHSSCSLSPVLMWLY